MRILFIVMFLILSPVIIFSEDKYLGGSTNNADFYLLDNDGNCINAIGLTYSTDYLLKAQCGAGTITSIDGTGDTITGNICGGHVVFNDAITYQAEQECKIWAEGSGTYGAAFTGDTGRIAYAPRPFKAISRKVIEGTLSAGSSSTSLISTAFVAGESSDYVGMIACVNNVENCAIVNTFDPATDTVTLMSSVGTVSTGMTVQLFPENLKEILNRLRARP